MFRGCFNASKRYWVNPAAEVIISNPLHEGVLDKVYFKEYGKVWYMTVHTGTTMQDGGRSGHEGAQVVFAAEALLYALRMVAAGRKARVYISVVSPVGTVASVEPSRMRRRIGKVDVLSVGREYPILSVASDDIAVLLRKFASLKG